MTSHHEDGILVFEKRSIKLFASFDQPLHPIEDLFKKDLRPAIYSEGFLPQSTLVVLLMVVTMRNVIRKIFLSNWVTDVCSINADHLLIIQEELEKPFLCPAFSVDKHFLSNSTNNPLVDHWLKMICDILLKFSIPSDDVKKYVLGELPKEFHQAIFNEYNNYQLHYSSQIDSFPIHIPQYPYAKSIDGKLNSLCNAPQDHIRVLFLGGEAYHKAFIKLEEDRQDVHGTDYYIQYYKDIRPNRIVTAITLEMQHIIDCPERLKMELRFVDLLIICLNDNQTLEVLKNPSADWFPTRIKRLNITVGVLAQSCELQHIDKLSQILANEKLLMCPERALMKQAGDLKAIKKIHRGNFDKYLYQTIHKKFIGIYNENLEKICHTLGNLDLKKQWELIYKIPKAPRSYFFTLQGTENCGIELLMKNLAQHMEIQEKVYHGVDCNSSVGPFNTPSQLLQRLFISITKEENISGMDSDELESDLKITLLSLLRTRDVCLILDSPYPHLTPEYIQSFWEEISQKIASRPVKHKFYLITFNKSQPFLKPNQKLDGDMYSIIFPSIDTIKPQDFSYFQNDEKRRSPNYKEYPFLKKLVSLDPQKVTEKKYLKSILKDCCTELGLLGSQYERALFPNYTR